MAATFISFSAVFADYKSCTYYFEHKKCKFAQSQVKFCGEIIGSGQRRIDSEKLEVIAKIQAATSKTELRQVLGLFSFFREYILRYDDLAQPLTDLTKKGVPNKLPWSEVHQQSLDKLKQMLIEAAKSTLNIVDFSKPFDVFVDASEKSQAFRHNKALNLSNDKGGLGCTCTWLSIGFLPKVDSCH